MSTEWPGAIQRFFSAFPASMLDPVWPASKVIDTLADTAEAIQVSLGVGVRGAFSTVAARFQAIEANNWVKTARIENEAVTNPKIAGMDAGKLTGTVERPVSTTTVTGSTRVSGEVVRAGLGSGNPSWRLQRYSGTLSSGGVQMVNHAVALMHRRFMIGEARWIDPGGTTHRLNLDLVNGSTFTVSSTNPAAAGRPWFGGVIFSEDSPEF